MYYRGGDAFVYTYDAGESVIREVPVEVGIFDTENIVIKSGLTMDDQVLTTWTSELKDGYKVSLADSEAAAGANQAEAAAE